MAVSREAVIWGIRLLHGAEPEEAQIAAYEGCADMDALRTALAGNSEARPVLGAADRMPSDTGYTVPPFLLRQPSSSHVRSRFEPPNLIEPVSQLCTSEQMVTPAYEALCGRLGLDPQRQHRKIWEFAFILAALDASGCLQPGRRGLGFGTGREPLPSAFAAAGAEIVATDAPMDVGGSQAWAQAAQWAHDLESLWLPDLVARDTFLDRVSFRPVDMNDIPTDLTGFDFCWSACCLEHLGSIRHGLDFIRNSLSTLKPGGVAVHTTEFNLRSDVDTIELPNLCLFRKRDIELILGELIAEGHRVAPLNLWPGAMPVDEHIDLPPYSDVHLKLQLGGYPTTSIGLIAFKADTEATTSL